MKFTMIQRLLILYLLALASFSLKAQTFDCNSDLYQVVNGKELKKLDPATGQYVHIGTSDISYNGAGFNYEDGYIYAIGSGTKLVKVASDGSLTDLGSIAGFTALTYSGDLDTLGNWYSFRKASGNWRMNAIDVSESPATAVEFEVTELSGVVNASNCADISFNSLTGKFYGMSSGKLIEFDPVNKTVKGIGDYSSVAESGGYGAVWSDVEGHSYFFNNSTGNIYKAAFDEQGNVLSFVFVSTSSPNSSNDGINCTLGAPPVFPEVCDNGVDDDGDGLIDCADPDCTATESCGVTSVVYNTDFACQGSIATFHLFFTNNASFPNSVSVAASLPTGFTFLQDTIEFDVSTEVTVLQRPSEGDTASLEWNVLTLQGGETVRISYDVSVDESAQNGVNTSSVDVALGTAGTVLFPQEIQSDISVGTCPEANQYECDPAFYQVYRKKGKNQPNVYGKLNPITGDYDPIAIASDYANGLGYDVQTGLVYGASGKTFIQLDEDGLVKDMGIQFNKKVYRGDINQSSQWYGVDGSDVVVIDVSAAPVVTATYSGQGLPGWDIAYNNDGHFYSIHNSTLFRFNTSSHLKENLGEISGINLPTSGGYGAQWTGVDGYLYASHNASGKILRIDVQSREARVVSYSVDGLSKNDGFSCPTEIPVVYEFDYGDNSKLPQSRVLSYRQDLSNDGIPDFSTVWLGNTVNFDASNPANATADGDLDDGVAMDAELNDGVVMASIGLNANYNGVAHSLIGIDWDDDGLFDETIVDSYEMSTAQTVFKSFVAPAGFESGSINMRVIVSEEALSVGNISGDIVAMGEVEDYRFFVAAPCDSPDCEVPTGNEGGLESNGDLAQAIARRNYNRVKNGYKGNLKANQPELKAFKAARANSSSLLHLYLPETGVFGTEETTVSSPLDLITLSNAKEVFAVDYYAKEKRVAAGLLLRTEGEVYNHSKNVCDRLNGKVVENVYLDNIDGVNVLIAKIVMENGAVEYSGWFSAKNDADGYHVFSYWNIDAYPDGDYLNFQAWSSSISQVLYILKHSLQQLEDEKGVISDTNKNKIPSVFVKKGEYSMGAIDLELLNINGEKSIVLNISARSTEYGSFVETAYNIELSGSMSETISVPTGHFFDAGLSLYAVDAVGYDALYLADGAWGVDYNEAITSLSQFDIYPEARDEPIEGYMVERGFEVRGESNDVINVYRNIKAGNATLSIAEFETIGFDFQSNQDIEVSLIPANLEIWDYRPKYTISASEKGKRVVLNLDDFAGLNKDTHLLKSLVFSYINQEDEPEQVHFKIGGLIIGSEERVLAKEDDLQKLLVYPNPVSGEGKIMFNLEQKSQYVVSIMSLDGRVVWQQTGSGEGAKSLSFSTENVQAGVYFLRLMYEGNDVTQKIVVR